jgi:hypothetical protein
MTYRIPALTLLGAVALTPWPADAESLGDYLQHGYAIARSTSFQGPFAGCKKKETLTFADGSTLTCAQTMHRSAISPRVYFLREDGEPPSVVLIAGQSYSGFVERFGNKILSSPYIMIVGALDDQDEAGGTGTASQTGSALTTGRIDPVMAVQSINELQKSDPTLLNTAQSQDVTRSPQDETEEAKDR